jgi:hypothetical protein
MFRIFLGKSERINLIAKHIIERTLSFKKTKWGGCYLSYLSPVLVGLGFWLVIDGALSIVKYPKQSFPEHLIRVIRAAVGVIVIIIGIVQN